MELRLKGFGTIEITDATRVEGDDILVKSADGFREIAETTDYKITEAYLVEGETRWSLVVWFDLPDNNWHDERAMVIRIENQDDIYTLNAAL